MTYDNQYQELKMSNQLISMCVCAYLAEFFEHVLSTFRLLLPSHDGLREPAAVSHVWKRASVCRVGNGRYYL